MFFMGKHIEAYSSDEPTKGSQIDYSNVYVHGVYTHKNIVRVIFVTIDIKRRTTPPTIDLRVKNEVGGYGNLRLSLQCYCSTTE